MEDIYQPNSKPYQVGLKWPFLKEFQFPFTSYVAWNLHHYGPFFGPKHTSSWRQADINGPLDRIDRWSWGEEKGMNLGPEIKDFCPNSAIYCLRNLLPLLEFSLSWFAFSFMSRAWSVPRPPPPTHTELLKYGFSTSALLKSRSYNSSLWGAVLCIAECLVASLAPTFSMPGARSTSCDNQKYRCTSTRGENHLELRIMQ